MCSVCVCVPTVLISCRTVIEFFSVPVAEKAEERLVAVPGSQDLCQILQDVGDVVYQQYRLTQQGSDFDSQSAFHINVSLSNIISALWFDGVDVIVRLCEIWPGSC